MKQTTSAHLPIEQTFLGVVTTGFGNINEQLAVSSPHQRRQSVLETSSPKSDAQPIDCILVFESHKDGQQALPLHQRTAEQRARFEAYLQEKYGMILLHVVGRSTTSEMRRSLVALRNHTREK